MTMAVPADTLFRQWDRVQNMLPTESDLGRYPAFLRANFPGIKYALAHGSTVYPLERMVSS